jgi:hypothetical protein
MSRLSAVGISGLPAGEDVKRIGKRKAGSLLDGVDHKAWPHSGVSDGTVGA